MNNGCGYTWPFYREKLAWCVRLDFPEINLPSEISMVTSKRRKKPPIKFNAINSLGFSISKVRDPIRFLRLTTTWNRQKISFALLREKSPEKSMLTWQISRDREILREILRHNFELVCCARCGSDICQKYVLFLTCNRTVGCSWTVKWKI